MAARVARVGAAIERFGYAVGNFGFFSAMRVFLWDRALRRKRLTSVPLLRSHRDFHFRGFEDFNALSHLMTIGYRISDTDSDEKIQWVVDAGANIGDETVRFAAFHADAQIIALEPESTNFHLLKRNTEGLQRVHCLQEGLWSHPTGLRIVAASDHISHRVEEVPADTPDAIRATSVQDLMQRYAMDRLDILKMDIEGSEGEVFSADELGWLKPVRCMIFEVPDNDCPLATQSIYRALDRLGLRFQSHVHGECMILIRADSGLRLERTAYLPNISTKA